MPCAKRWRLERRDVSKLTGHEKRHVTACHIFFVFPQVLVCPNWEFMHFTWHHEAY